MDEKRWWLEEGVIVEYLGRLYRIKKTDFYDDGNKRLYISTESEYVYFKTDKSYSHEKIITEADIKLVGVPFDCMPDWAVKIQFTHNGEFQFIGEYKGMIHTYYSDYTPYHKSPEEWKGKTFEITDELRELLNG